MCGQQFSIPCVCTSPSNCIVSHLFHSLPLHPFNFTSKPSPPLPNILPYPPSFKSRSIERRISRTTTRPSRPPSSARLSSYRRTSGSS